jgi:phage terminase large subunit
LNFSTAQRRLRRLECLAAEERSQTSSAALPYPLEDPLEFAKILWPHLTFYDKQCEVIRSLMDNDETFVVAGNMLGKDFVAGFLAVWFFLAHHPVRVLTTSVKEDHLRVLWGEINQFLQTSRVPLTVKEGGPLLVKHREIRKIVKGKVCPISYLRGCVSAKGEGMAGHHAAHTLVVIDEASGVDDQVYHFSDTWAKRKLIFGNPHPCSNFFFRGVEEGDVQAASSSH